MAAQRPLAADVLARWRAEASALDALEPRDTDRRARVSVIDVSVVLTLLDEIEKLKTCVHAGAKGVCMPRTSDGRCIWCERSLPPGWLESVLPRSQSPDMSQAGGRADPPREVSAMTDAELVAMLEKSETALEERWDDAKGERRQLLLAACEGVGMAQRLFTAGPDDPDPRMLEAEPRVRPNRRR
jgi:hypothetical protein